MGVSGLMSLMARNKIGEYVDLADIAENYRIKNRKRPVVLVEMSSCLRHLYTGKSLPLAAEVKKFKERCERFVDHFYDLGIELYIIGEGLMLEVNVARWVKRAEEVVGENIAAYFWANLEGLKDRSGFLFPIAQEIFASSAKCRFRRALYDADDFIAQYLRKWGAFAILSFDSDFIFMEGYDHFLSMKDLDLQRNRTYNFNRYKLARFLAIDVKLLPLVGTLCPNGVLSKDDLEKFYRQHGIIFSNRFSDVAKTVSKLSLNEKISEGSQNLQSLLCLNKNQLEKFQGRLASLSGGHGNSELKLTNDQNWNDILTFAVRLHSKGDSDRALLELLSKRRIFLRIGLERADMTTPDEELQHLRRKIYGFMFSEYPEEVTITEHLFVFSQDSGKAEYCRREVTFPKHDHVGLLKLWSSDAAEDVRKQRHKFFFEFINEKLDADTLLEKVQLEFVFPLVAVFYLHCELGRFESFEADTLLMQSVLANKLSLEEVAEYECIANFDAVNLTGWFVKVIDYLELINVLCGNPFEKKKTSLVNYYEGLLLMRVYEEMKNGVKIIDYSKIPEVVTTYNSLKEVLNEMKKSCGYE